MTEKECEPDRSGPARNMDPQVPSEDSEGHQRVQEQDETSGSFQDHRTPRWLSKHSRRTEITCQVQTDWDETL